MARIDEKTLQDLEFPTVLQQISRFCITPAGAEKILGCVPSTNFENVSNELQRVREFIASFENENGIPNHGFDSIQKELQLLEIENSSLELPGFRRILTLSESTKSLLGFFSKYKEFYVHLHSFSEPVPFSPVLSAEINKILDRYGEVKDSASETLALLRKELQIVKGKINSSFLKALKNYSQNDYLDEIKESVVENRRVLAVKAMHRKKVKGAVLGGSKTGSIVYIEPQETLDFANEHSNLLYEEQQELKRIIKALTEKTRPHKELLKTWQEYLISIDLLFAKAKYAEQINGIVPVLVREKRLSLQQAFHPLLFLANKRRKKKTFPQTIELNPESRIIVISGPNAGGKSITLKTVGLLQIMLQSGIPIPVDPKSELCFFDTVLTDIGDNQSIENHLSTYSYRLKKMKQFLKKCDENTLFLIDEFGTGSDPELGGALAEAFLETFYERGAFGLITTHYSNLKLLANELPNATNANMQFDRRTLEPLYHLHLGEAGSSFTFEVAQKNGIPYSLINKAKKKIEGGKVRFDKTIGNLQKERAELRKTSETLKTEAQKAKQENALLEETNAKAKEKLERYQEVFDANQKLISLGKKVDALSETYFNNRQKKQLIDELMKIVLLENSKRKKVAPKQKKIEKRKTTAILNEVEKKVEVIRSRKKKEKEVAKAQPPSPPKTSFKIGDRVRMIDGKAIGTIDKLEKNKAVINYGIFTTNVSIDALEKI